MIGGSGLASKFARVGGILLVTVATIVGLNVFLANQAANRPAYGHSELRYDGADVSVRNNSENWPPTTNTGPTQSHEATPTGSDWGPGGVPIGNRVPENGIGSRQDTNFLMFQYLQGTLTLIISALGVFVSWLAIKQR